MDREPLVSVITITRNRGNLIGRAIKSVLNQTYKNIEYIVVDGASDDNTDEVVGRFNDERLHYTKLESNWPIASTINHGVSISHGEYVTFLDSDDEYLPTKLEMQLKKIQTLPEDYGMVYCWMTYYDSKTLSKIRIHNPQIKGNVSNSVVEKPIVSGTPTFFFRRQAFLENGGWKDADEIGIVSDWEMAARFCQKWKVDFVPESLIKVYINHTGTTRMSSSSYYKDFDDKMIKFHTYFLRTYEEIFNKYPRRAVEHYVGLSGCYLHKREFAKGIHYYFKLLSCLPNIRQMLYPIYRMLR